LFSSILVSSLFSIEIPLEEDVSNWHPVKRIIEPMMRRHNLFIILELGIKKENNLLQFLAQFKQSCILIIKIK